MKKNVRLQINALAKKIIVEGDNIETNALKGLVLKLYEKLTILEYLERPSDLDLKTQKKEALDSKTYREENWFHDPKPVPQPQDEDELVEPLMEKIKDIVAQMPHESEQIDELLEEILPKKEVFKNELEDFASTYQKTPVFERKEQEEAKQEIAYLDDNNQPSDNKSPKNKQKSLNDKLNQGLNIGLNDRLAFIKHLFEGKADEYTRVLSQINTMSSYKEASVFIEGNVKPDYKDWNNKDEYADRFMLIIEKRFN